MITITIDGKPTHVPDWWSVGNIAFFLCAMVPGHYTSWSADTNAEDFAVMEALCAALSVPCRTWEEMQIESYGGSQDRPTYLLGSLVFPPSDYLD